MKNLTFSWKHWNFQLRIGVIIVAFFLILGFIVPLFCAEDPSMWGTYFKNMKPSNDHILGTTGLGQDTFWLLTFSIRSSLIIGIVTALLSTVIGVIVGLSAGFKGGWYDRFVTLTMDTFIVVPSLPVLILIGTLTKGRMGTMGLALSLVLFNWAWPARQTRSMALSLREKDFIDTARFSGDSTFNILYNQILPYVVSWSFANFINCTLVAIGIESSLAVIGMTNNARTTLGTMIYWAKQYQAMLGGRWFWIVSPVVVIAVLFVGLYCMQSGAQRYSTYRRGKAS